ncbi:H(+)-transporting two-sector ATPase [Flexistipes sinusarabici DSM 4947]|uniref:H(+)-transporting two-sector ATPase n=2 Tax=Flexistipes sinusarabici TaxID=2352 RepID=F8E9H6_FLESM|nr:potassium transporter TrkG [Flexistipes sinusarabici]AEI15305.1 H(+)-transporting two-sector ATPase [Flexistipes sinusarabici DSM 4947]
MFKFKINPWMYLFITFALFIIAGTFLLKMPFVKHTEGLSYIDALFTATSAVCVTGLIVVDTSGFNFWGQFFIMLMMQVGAIGIMTLTSSLLLFLRGELDFSRKFMVAKISDSLNIQEAEKVLVIVVIYTFVMEFVGFLALSYGFFLDGFALKDAAYYGLFHAVSAFCNAGFSTFDSSLIGSNSIVKVTTMFLIVFGGLGFYVIYNIFMTFVSNERIKVHTKIVVYTTFALIIAGTLLIFMLEKGTMSILDSFFQSITTRTAGFNTVEIGGLHIVTKFLMIVLMIIGASPGSTGGGIKTTAFYIAVVSMYSILRGNKRIVIFNRNIALINILKAYALISMYIFFLVIATLLLLYFGDFTFMDTLFEVTSALGTVGLSLGITAKLGIFGKLIITACMFLGRIGPATLITMLLLKEKTSKLSYPEEKIILG